MENLWMIFDEDPARHPSKKYYLESADNLKISYSVKYVEHFKIEDDVLYYDEKIVVNLPPVILFRFRHAIELELYQYFEKRNKRIVNNAFCLNHCNDKFVTYEFLESYRIKQPKTVAFGESIEYKDLAEMLGKTFIAKDRFGSEGKEVFLVTNSEEFREVTKEIKKENLIFQEFIEESAGKDLRVYVVGEKAVGSVIRSNKTGFRSNVAQGASAELYEMTPAQKKYAVEVAKALNGEIVSVDFLMNGEELIFCEANSNAGLISAQGKGIPVADMIMKYIQEVIEIEQTGKAQDLWLIYEPGESPEELAKHFDKYDIDYEARPIGKFATINGKLYYQDALVDNKDLPKVVLFRFREAETELELCKYFEKNGVRVVNNYFCMYNCNDKISTYRLLKKLRIKQPKTLFFSKSVSYNEVAKKLGEQFVAKDRMGQNGVNVFLINNAEEFNQALEAIGEEKIIYQEFIKESFGKDLRTYVVGNEVVGAVMRQGSNDFRSNISQGAKPYPYELSEEERALSFKIAKAINNEIVSVDFLFKDDELIFCEANSNAWISSFVKLGIPVAEAIVKYTVDVIKGCN